MGGKVGATIAAGVALVVGMVFFVVVVVMGAMQARAACSPTPLPGVPAEPGTGDALTVQFAHANLYVGMTQAEFQTDLAAVATGAPDFITLNETYQRTDAALTPPGYDSWRAAGPRDALETPVLWKASTWRKVRSGTTLMHQHPVKWGTRYTNWVTLRSTATGGVVSVVSGHASPGGPGREGLLSTYLGGLTRLIAELSRNGPVIVGADLNTGFARRSPAQDLVAQRIAPAGAVSTFTALGEPSGGWATGDRGGTIDYVLVAGGAAPRAHATADLRFSDHRLVTAAIDLPATSSPSTPVPAQQQRLEVPQVPGWSLEQVGNAAAIIAAGDELQVPARAQAIAVMTAIGESGLRVLDHGDAAGPDSRGLFQQRDNGAWGTLADRMDPRRSSIMFYEALLKVPGWQDLPPSIAAHRTQHNADPHHYEPFWPKALDLMAALSGSEATTELLDAGAHTICDRDVLVATGPVTYPVPARLVSTNSDNFGDTGASWASTHTGTDFSIPCGTPVMAMHAGVVTLDRTQGWAGSNLVGIKAADVTTWYAHMQSANVTEGQRVSPGQVVGVSGTEGNSRGCHLHVEVREPGTSPGTPSGALDPTAWLTENVGADGTATTTTSEHRS